MEEGTEAAQFPLRCCREDQLVRFAFPVLVALNYCLLLRGGFELKGREKGSRQTYFLKRRQLRGFPYLFILNILSPSHKKG